MKTISLKKVSAVAVASLGFGLLSVVPANAANSTPTVGTATQAATVGTAATTTIGLTVTTTTGTTIDTGSTVTIGKPTGSTVSLSDRDGGYSTATTAMFTTDGETGASMAATVSSSGVIGGDTGSEADGALVLGTITIVPDVPGLYSVTVLSHGTTTAVAYMQAAGIAGTVATSGLGTTAITATVNGIASFTYTTPSTTSSGDVFRFTSSGVGAITAATGVAANGTSANNPTEISGVSGSWAGGATWTRSNASAGTATITVSSTAAGTQTVTVTGINATSGAPTAIGTITITWGETPVTSAALSTSFICAGAVTTCSADATVLAAKTAQTSAGNRAASIQVTVRDSAGTSKVATQTITVTISGPGTLGLGTDAGAASAGRALTGTAGQNLISVFGDGTEGKATITISQGTTVIATETVSFYGAVAKVTASQNLSNPLANGYLLGSAHATSGTTMTAAASWANASGNLPAVQLTLTDASGNLIPSQAANISAVSSDATVMSKTITAVEDTTATYGAGIYNVSVSSASGSAAGKSATLTFRVLLADGLTYISSAPVTFTTGSNKISKVAITLDKTTYTAGDPAVMTVKATDAAGLAVADGLYASSTYAAPLFSKSIVAISTMPTDSTMATIGGKKDYKFYAPSVPGAFTVTGTYINSDAGLVPTTGTASVTDGNAAIITQIDALNAKIVALNALIAKIMKKLGVK